MDFQLKWLVFGLIVWQTGWLVDAGDPGVGGMEIPVTDCGDTCTSKERCVPDDNSSLAQANLGVLPRCVLTNECQYPCSLGKTCCGDTCECIWPRYRRSSNQAYCDECECHGWNRLCTIKGECICDDHHVLVGGPPTQPPTLPPTPYIVEEAEDVGGKCVLCNPNNTCPDCPVGRTCTFAPGNPNGTCECSPGTVENKDGDCVHCIPCPEECPVGQVCLADLDDSTAIEAYCGCPPGSRLKDGKCVPTPACSECSGDQVCVIHGGVALCECPHSHVFVGEQCMPIAVCPDCPQHEICVIPDNGDEPYCKCEEGYLRQGGVCLHCFYKEEITLLKEDECYHHSDCNHGKLCTNSQCECPKNYTPKWGRCIRPGLAGGLCDNGECYGKHVTCGASGYCECSSDAEEEPQPVCIPKRK